MLWSFIIVWLQGSFDDEGGWYSTCPKINENAKICAGLSFTRQRKLGAAKEVQAAGQARYLIFN